MTAEAPASSAIFACSTFITSMMTLISSAPVLFDRNIETAKVHLRCNQITHPPFNICAKPVLTPKVPAPPPLVPVEVLALVMRLGVEEPPLPLAVVGRALAEGTIVGFSDDIVGGCICLID
jgi:hypothetical protein